MLLKGKAAADKINKETLAKVVEIKKKGVVPTLAIVRVGDNPGDIAYENSAVKKAEALGIRAERSVCSPDILQSDLIALIEGLNRNSRIHGILLLQPLPSTVDADAVRNAVAPEKDADCVTDKSLGNIFIGKKGFAPCTAEGCVEILKACGILIKGKKTVIIGRSLVVGKPLAMMLLRENASVTICHTKTDKEDLKEYCRNADIIITAAGHMNTLTGDMVKEGQTVIDVGINFDEAGKMRGDVDFEEVSGIVQNITPVPGGAGGVTASVLLRHVAQAAEMAL